MQSFQVHPDIDIITSNFPIPGLGHVPINAFVLKGAEPLLVDTGAGVEREDFLSALRTVIDPAELRWLWLTHPDPDHIGSLHGLLADHPQIRVVTSFLGVGILSLTAPVPLDRVYLINPGERLVLPDRTLTAFKPPAYDSPATTGFYDDRSRALFTSDCFGALLADPPRTAAELPEHELRDGQILWATIDAPWLHKADPGLLGRELEAIRAMQPAMILSSHLPPAESSALGRLLAALASAPAARPFVGPNQAALEQMLKQAADGGA